MTLYAVWTPANYKVTIKFNGNGGTCNAADRSVTVLSSVTLPSTEVTREGYRLVGWTLNKNDEDNYKQPGASITADSDMTYYALWESTTGNSNLSSVITDTDMFKGDEQLQGSNGTGYNSINVDSSYAHPDGGADNPGYFTERFMVSQIVKMENHGTISILPVEGQTKEMKHFVEIHSSMR